MAYLAVSKSGKEYIFRRKPKRTNNSWDDAEYGFIPYNIIQPNVNGYIADPNYGTYDIKKPSTRTCLPTNSIIALTGKKLTWEDEAIKI